MAGPGRPTAGLHRLGLGLLVVSALLLAACEGKPPREAPPPAPKPVPESKLLLEPRGFADLPGWQEDRLAEAASALRRSCATLTRRADGLPVGPRGLAGRVEDWRPPCDALKQLAAGGDDAGEAASRRFFETWFQPFLVTDQGKAEGLFTGYYEAELEADTKPNGAYRYPLYRLPPDLVTVDLGLFRGDLDGKSIIGRVEKNKLVPYYSRAEIDGGVLKEQRAELLWSNDPVDVFFLHVQGSGQVKLPDGRVTRVGFAGSNGLPFYAIGRALIEAKRLDGGDLSMQGIRDWLRAHPKEAQELMQRNSRYIFFREITGEGPIGAQGVALTPGRSLAVDTELLPLGAPLYLDTTWPASSKPLQRLFVAQDSGSAIKGAVRGDVFWGAGEEALAVAGRMKQKGRYFLFLPKAVAERRAGTS